MTDTRLPTIAAGSRVQAIIPTDFDSAYRIAQAVCVAGIAPKGLDTPERAFVAILHGLEVGFAPMQALQSIAVINGRPSIWGDGAIGLVRASGVCDYVHERIEGGGDERVAICEAQRRGEPRPVVGRFSVADAKLAGLWGKKGRSGEPTPWVTYPDRMLQMRARAFALRDGFADVLRGLHIAEEMADIPADSKVMAPSPDDQRRASIPKATEAPPLSDPVMAGPPEPETAKASPLASVPPQTEFYSKRQKVLDPNPVVITRFLDGSATPVGDDDSTRSPSVKVKTTAGEAAFVPLAGRARKEPEPEPFDTWKWLDDLEARFLACKTAEDLAGVHDDMMSRKDEIAFPSDWRAAETLYAQAKARVE